MSDWLKCPHQLSFRQRDLFPMQSEHIGDSRGKTRLARNARGCSAPCVDITLFGVPLAFPAFLGPSIV
jgi:hypothetical protein